MNVSDGSGGSQLTDAEQFDLWLEQLAARRPSSDARLDGGLDLVDSTADGRGGLRRQPGTSRRRQRSGGRPGDLPELVIPGGYFRDGRGTWRRRADRSAVPHSRDVTLHTLWGELVGRDGAVRIPAVVALAAPELEWARAVGDLSTFGGRHILTINADDWDDRCQWPLGMEAPEIAPSQLVGVSEIAAMLGVSDSTVTAYLARGRLPEPTFVMSGRPRWSWPVLLLSGTLISRR